MKLEAIARKEAERLRKIREAAERRERGATKVQATWRSYSKRCLERRKRELKLK